MPVTTISFLNRLTKNFDDGLALMQRKNSDYAGTDDPFRNFRGSTMIGLKPGHAILLRMLDKISRVATLLDKEAQVTDESIGDTLTDLMNYANILKVWYETEGRPNGGPAGV